MSEQTFSVLTFSNLATLTNSVLTFSCFSTQAVRPNAVLTFSVQTFSSFSTQAVRTNSVLFFSCFLFWHFPVLTFSVLTFSILTFSCFQTQSVRTNSFVTFSVLTFSCFGAKTVRTKSVLTFSCFLVDIFLFWLFPFWLKAHPPNWIFHHKRFWSLFHWWCHLVLQFVILALQSYWATSYRLQVILSLMSYDACLGWYAYLPLYSRIICRIERGPQERLHNETMHRSF